MWWRKKKKVNLEEAKKSGELPYSIKNIRAMVDEATPLLVGLKNLVWNMPINHESSRRTLERFAEKLQLRFPVELALEHNKPWSEFYPMLMLHETGEEKQFILSMKHRANYGNRSTLDMAIDFLIRAKMTETGFPGIMVNGDKRTRDVFAEIAYQIRDPYFPGGELQNFGRVYPYWVFITSQNSESIDKAAHGALRTFYTQHCLTKIFPSAASAVGHAELIHASHLYEFNLLKTLMNQEQKPAEQMVTEIAVVAAESKLNYGRRLAFIPSFCSEELERLVEIHGSELFMEALKEKYGRVKVEQTYSIIRELPLENGKGFAPILQDICRVMNRLHVFLARRQVMDMEEIQRLGLNLKMAGWWGGLRGNVTLKKGPPITLLPTDQLFKKYPDEIKDRQEKIIGRMPVGANSESERKDYVDFLLSSLEACSNQSPVNKSLGREIERTDCSQPSPSLYRRLSMKVLLALDERRMRDEPETRDKEEDSKVERPHSVTELSNCPCQNKQEMVFNPIACFVRATQEQVGAENAAVLMRGDIFTLAFSIDSSKKQPFPWEHVMSLESGIYVDDSVLENYPPDALLNKIMTGFAQHAKNWGNLLSLKSWFVSMPSKGKMLKIPFDIGPSDIVGFDSLFGNIATTTGHLYGNEAAQRRLTTSMARQGLGLNYHVARTTNLYKHTVALAKAWSEIKQPHPDILKGWEKLATPAYSYLLLMLASGLRGDPTPIPLPPTLS